VAAPLTTLLERRSPTATCAASRRKHFLYERHGYEAGVGGVFLGSLDAAPAEQASRRVLPDLANVAYVRILQTGKGIRAVRPRNDALCTVLR